MKQGAGGHSACNFCRKKSIFVKKYVNTFTYFHFEDRTSGDKEQFNRHKVRRWRAPCTRIRTEKVMQFFFEHFQAIFFLYHFAIPFMACKNRSSNKHFPAFLASSSSPSTTTTSFTLPHSGQPTLNVSVL